jgi:hypothetical protein
MVQSITAGDLIGMCIQKNGSKGEEAKVLGRAKTARHSGIKITRSSRARYLTRAGRVTQKRADRRAR